MRVCNQVVLTSENLTDASHPLSGPRFSKILASFKPIKPSSPKESLSVSALVENLTHFSTPTLAHLIALFSHQAPDYPAPNTSLIIVDSFSTLIGAAFPRAIGPTSTPKGPGGMAYSTNQHEIKSPRSSALIFS
jgi:hypothetical protein